MSEEVGTEGPGRSRGGSGKSKSTINNFHGGLRKRKEEKGEGPPTQDCIPDDRGKMTFKTFNVMKEEGEQKLQQIKLRVRE